MDKVKKSREEMGYPALPLPIPFLTRLKTKSYHEMSAWVSCCEKKWETIQPKTKPLFY